MRLNRYLALCGLGSRRACEVLVLEGRVTVNGRRIQELATEIEPGDRVTADGRDVSAAEHLTLVLYKPPKVMSTKSDPQGRLTLYDLLPPLAIGLGNSLPYGLSLCLAHMSGLEPLHPSILSSFHRSLFALHLSTTALAMALTPHPPKQVQQACV